MAGLVAGFSPLRLQYESGATHVLYIREHRSRRADAALPQGFTIFVLNPPLGGETVLEAVFAGCGDVTRVSLSMHRSLVQDTLEEAPVAHVVFRKKNSVARALQLAMDSQTAAPAMPSPSADAYGMKRWRKDYWAARPPVAELQQRIKDRVMAFEDNETKQKALQLSQTDEDGWTVVTKGRKPGVKAKDAAQPTVKKGKKELQNFYRFQKVEAQKQSLADLRRRFADDKQHMEQMRAQRRFRPY